MTTTQNAQILRLLRERGVHGLTPIEALNLIGTFRLGARIFELREQGHDIENIGYTTPSGSHVACYVLREKPPVTDGDQTEMGLTA